MLASGVVITSYSRTIISKCRYPTGIAMKDDILLMVVHTYFSKFEKYVDIKSDDIWLLF
jgi:hypothetical protein